MKALHSANSNPLLIGAPSRRKSGKSRETSQKVPTAVLANCFPLKKIPIDDMQWRPGRKTHPPYHSHWTCVAPYEVTHWPTFFFYCSSFEKSVDSKIWSCEMKNIFGFRTCIVGGSLSITQWWWTLVGRGALETLFSHRRHRHKSKFHKPLSGPSIEQQK